jgi:hypothetical protein
MTYTIACLGDSQTQMSPFYAVSPDRMWVEQLGVKLRAAGAKIRARSYGIGGQSTGEMVNRADILSLWEVPDVAVLYGGVNDPQTGYTPTLAASGTGGTINVSAGATYYETAFLFTFNDGSVMATAPAALQFTAGTTNSITVTGGSSKSTIASIAVYVSPTGYASSAAALAAGTRVMRLQGTFASAASGTITALSAGAAQMPTAGTQAMTQAFVKAMKYGVLGSGAGAAKNNWVLGQANLPANGYPGQRAVVLDDTSTTGGLAAVGTGQHARIAGDFSAAPQQTVWEYRTPQAGEAGWGRVAVTGTAAFAGCCSRIVCISTNYLNFTSGGDNAGASTFYAINVPVRAATLAAATAEGIPYCDLFGFQSGLIASGETTQGSNSWHAIANNQHHNNYGHDIVARAAYATIAAQSVWLAALSG